MAQELLPDSAFAGVEGASSASAQPSAQLLPDSVFGGISGSPSQYVQEINSIDPEVPFSAIAAGAVKGLGDVGAAGATLLNRGVNAVLPQSMRLIMPPNPFNNFATSTQAAYPDAFALGQYGAPLAASAELFPEAVGWRQLAGNGFWDGAKLLGLNAAKSIPANVAIANLSNPNGSIAGNTAAGVLSSPASTAFGTVAKSLADAMFNPVATNNPVYQMTNEYANPLTPQQQQTAQRLYNISIGGNKSLTTPEMIGNETQALAAQKNFANEYPALGQQYQAVTDLINQKANRTFDLLQGQNMPDDINEAALSKIENDAQAAKNAVSQQYQNVATMAKNYDNSKLATGTIQPGLAQLGSDSNSIKNPLAIDLSAYKNTSNQLFTPIQQAMQSSGIAKSSPTFMNRFKILKNAANQGDLSMSQAINLIPVHNELIDEASRLGDNYLAGNIGQLKGSLEDSIQNTLDNDAASGAIPSYQDNAGTWRSDLGDAFNQAKSSYQQYAQNYLATQPVNVARYLNNPEMDRSGFLNQFFNKIQPRRNPQDSVNQLYGLLDGTPDLQNQVTA